MTAPGPDMWSGSGALQQGGAKLKLLIPLMRSRAGARISEISGISWRAPTHSEELSCAKAWSARQVQRALKRGAAGDG